MNLFKNIIRRFPGFRIVDNYLRNRYDNERRELFPRGHFYSPLPDVARVRAQADLLFCKDVNLDPSLKLHEAFQEALLKELLTFAEDFNWPEKVSPEKRYYFDNGFFRHGSAFSLYATLRQFRPKRIIEIGSGFTSALMLDTNDRFLDGQVEFTFIEPNPARLFSLLREDDRKRCRIIEDIVQNVPVSTFAALGSGDMLFVDSSHVSKIGSDVNYIFFEVLPALRSGVIIHIHDIYWPFEYPEQWIAEGRSWNEAYLLRAFLQYNNAFEILQFNDYLAYRYREYYQEFLPRVWEDPGSSIWLRKL